MRSGPSPILKKSQNMKQFIKGSAVGTVITLVAVCAYVYAVFGPNLLYVMRSFSVAPKPPAELEKYKEDTYSYYTNYQVNAAFMDEDSATEHARPLAFYREEIALEVYKRDYEKVCVQAYDSSHFDVAIKLTPEKREKLRSTFITSEERFQNSFRGYEQRFYIEAGADRIKSFWVSQKGAEQYAKKIAADPNDFDFILKVPFGQTYSFQFYLTNGMTDLPIEGCTSDVDVHKIPQWDLLMKEFWDRD